MTDSPTAADLPAAAADLPAAIAGAISAELRAAVSSLCHVARETDTPLYLVGGMVRDCLLLDAPPTGGALDFDLAVDADPSPLFTALPNARWVSHDRFGSASARLVDGSRIDLVRARSERYPAPAALPVVEPAPIEVDLGRRDFSVNAAAFGLSGPHRGTLLDPHGGVRDAARRQVRVLHERSFQDDPTRLVRLCRYAARVGGRPERRTRQLARAATPGLADLSPARFGDAWRALLQDSAAAEALRRARRLRLPQSRLPGWEISALAASVVRGGSADTALRCWAAIGLTCSEPSVVVRLPQAAALRREERAALQAGAALRRSKHQITHARRLSLVAELVAHAPDVALEVAAELWKGYAGKCIGEVVERRHGVRSPLSGADLLALGAPQGPLIGAWLRRLEDGVWDGVWEDDEEARIAGARHWVRLWLEDLPGMESEEGS